MFDTLLARPVNSSVVRSSFIETMLLKGAENTEFEMKVVGYQFPHLENEPYDSDWLNISVRVAHPRGAWSATDACMLTWEAASLAESLRRMADDAPAHSEENFIEPELHFEWFGEGQNRLRVYLDYSLRPAWSSYHGLHIMVRMKKKNCMLSSPSALKT